MQDAFYVALLRPFLAIPVLLIAFYIGRWLERFIPDGKVKRFLTRPRSNRSAFFERMDAAMFAFLKSMWRKLRPQKAAQRRRYLP